MATPTSNIDKKVSLGDVPFSLPFLTSEPSIAIAQTTNQLEKKKESNNTNSRYSGKRNWIETMKKFKFAATWLTLPQIIVKAIQLVRLPPL